MDVKLHVNGKEVVLNEFVQKMLGGMVAGAVTSLRGIEKNWTVIRVEVAKPVG